MMTIDDLTPYHRTKALGRAAAWRLEHHKEILASMKGVHTAEKPTGHAIFEPTKWSAANWIWFSEHLVNDIKRRMNG